MITHGKYIILPFIIKRRSMFFHRPRKHLLRLHSIARACGIMRIFRAIIIALTAIITNHSSCPRTSFFAFTFEKK
jgi:hypothetical protein